MEKWLLSIGLAAFAVFPALAADTDDTRLRDVAPRAEQSRDAGPAQRVRRYGTHRHRPDRHYRTRRDASHYRYRPHRDYVYRPFPPPPRRSTHHRHERCRHLHAHRGHYRRGDGIRISPCGVTIFLGIDR